ncbi:TonB-dependent receptor [Sphingobacterium alkalisoli]|nr:TonB-dependent receptor [Sphingobacterium alkalisoli]
MIQMQTGIIIFYSNEVVTDDMKYNSAAEEIDFRLLLDQSLKQAGLTYKNIDDKVIAIYPVNVLQQPRAEISGRVTDSTGVAVEFASLRLFQGDRLISVSSTAQDGSFVLKELLKPATMYTIQISSMSHMPKTIRFIYPDDKPLRLIVLSVSQIQIKTVAVKAFKQPFERVADRFIVNVEGSSLESGLSTLEILQRSPGLWVDPNGNIRIRGNQGVQVMINDIVQRMSSEQLAEYLRSLPSENISKIEIIPNPAAEYEAAGTAGIIRIVLRKNGLDGFRANLMARYLQQVKDPYYNVGTIMDFKKSNFYLTGVLGYLRNDEYIMATNDVTYVDNSTYHSITDRFRESKSYNARLTTIYDIRDNQSLGFQALINKNNTDQDFYTDNTHLTADDTLYKQTSNNWLTNPTQFSSTLNYNWKRDSLGSSLKLLTDFVSNNHREENNYVLTDFNTGENQQYVNYSPSNTKIFSIQSDWTQYYASGLNWLAGLKFISTERNNEVLRNNLIGNIWIKDEGLSNEFTYNERLFMGYAAINYKRNKSSVKAGLRAEYTDVNALSITLGERVPQNYLNFFPSIFLLHELGDSKNALFLNYAKRIRRPSFRDLNPYTLQIDDFILLQGNAELTPEFTHRVQSGFQFKNGAAADLYFAYNKDKIALFTETIDNKILAYQSRNFGYSIDYGANFFTPWKIYAWWSGQFNTAWYKTNFEIDGNDLSQQTWEASVFQSFKIKKWLDSSLYLGYVSPTISANTKFANQFYSSLTLSKRIAKDKGKVSLHWNDIFNTSREREWTARNGTFINFYQKRPTQVFGISLSYMISRGKKIEDKNLEESSKEIKSRAN